MSIRRSLETLTKFVLYVEYCELYSNSSFDSEEQHDRNIPRWFALVTVTELSKNKRWAQKISFVDILIICTIACIKQKRWLISITLFIFLYWGFFSFILT